MRTCTLTYFHNTSQALIDYFWRSCLQMMFHSSFATSLTLNRFCLKSCMLARAGTDFSVGKYTGCNHFSTNLTSTHDHLLPLAGADAS